jgi:hypothetical protein
MAKNKVEIDVKVDDKGTTKKVGLNAKNASKGLDDVGRSARNADRNLKGAAQASSNSTKNFSKMAQGTGGLVAAYATLAANIFAISAAYGFLKRAGDLVALTRGQEQYAQKTGKSMKLLTSRMQEATGGLLAFDEASQAAAIGTAAGISSDQLEGLAKIAKNASVALGRDLTDSFNRLTKGAIKAEPELLDELGIVLRLEKASGDYARALGKNAKDLTTFEKSQAVVNAVLEQGNRKFDDVGENVNEVARLGKAFDDLVKDLMKFIEPAASFISGVLADNVKALAAAFGVLGLSIARALVPAGPQLAKFSDMAAGAKERLVASAGTGKLGQNIAAGNIGARELTAIDKGAGAATSTVIDQSKMTKNQFKRDVAIMRADHARMVAANTTGFKKYTANVKAYLLAMQAEHGRVMGTMKAATAGLATFASKALNAVAIIGMISLAITFIKEFIEYFKDPALKKLETHANTMASRYAEQNEEIGGLIDNFKAAETPAENLVKQANLLSNFSFKGIDQMTKGLQSATKTIGITGGNNARVTETTEDPAENAAYAKAIDGVVVSLKKQMTAMAQFGLSSEEATKQQQRLVRITNAQAIMSKGARGQVDEYNGSLDVLKTELVEAGEAGRTFSTLLAPHRAAISNIANTIEAFDKFRAKSAHAESRYNTFIGYNKSLSSSLQQVEKTSQGKTLGAFFTPEQVSSYSSILGFAAKDLTIKEAIAALDKQRAAIRKQEQDIELSALNTSIRMEKISRNRTKLQVADLVRQKAIEDKKIAIRKIEQDIAFQNGLGAELDSTKINQLTKQKELLEAQLQTAKDLHNEQKQLGAAFKSGFESQMVTSIADIIKGNESSLKDAMLTIAKSALDAVADKLAEQIAKPISDFLFGKPPELVATEENTAAIKANTAALTGTSVPGAGSTGSTSGGTIGSKLKKLGSDFLGIGSGGQTDGVTAEMVAEGKNLPKGTMEEVIVTGNKSKGLKGIFDGFVGNVEAIFQGDQGFLEGLGNIFKDGLAGFGDLFGDLLGGLFGGEGGSSLFGDLVKGVGSLFGFGGPAARNGGVFSAGKKVQGYASGGIAKGSTGGYPAVLHGTEAVVPLPHGGKIPVEMKGGGNQQNNITVNVSSNGTAATEAGDASRESEQLGKAVAAAVQAELQNQKRSGGILSPYGAA